MKFVNQIASSFQAMVNCKESGNDEWYDNHQEKILELTKEHGPHGSGFDSDIPVCLDFEKSKPERLIIKAQFHPLNENGFYDPWMFFKIVVKPSLVHGYTMKIQGLYGKQKIHEEYFYQLFGELLSKEI